MNRYDDFQPDVAALLKDQDARLAPADPQARSADGLGMLGRPGSIGRLYWRGLLVKTGLHRRLVYANWELGWLREFQAYWMTELGNRPLQPHDFYFLAGVYRQRLQTIHFESIESLELANDASHLEAWRDHRIVHHLFAHTYRQALSPLRVHRYTRYIRRGGRVAEYGCGTAPILDALARWYRHLNLHLVGADIPHLLFHFARWRFREARFVTMVPIGPNDDAPLPGRYDTIFCLEVLEHLPRPLPVLAHLHEALEPGGHLIFDYVRSEGTGLDTASALRDRIPALEFLRERFAIVEGAVPLDGSHVEPVVARKR
jgi:2-polyprenyl-3-methyl-5-hydroxy-6-metoxy-1,4-benzoquinol methylase